MSSTFIRATGALTAVLSGTITVTHSQGAGRSWLDAPAPSSWHAPGATVPVAPKPTGVFNERCRALARPAQTDQDERLRDEGLDLVDAYQGGWHMVVVRGTASYDGMCRPLQYQIFVFVRGTFAG